MLPPKDLSAYSASILSTANEQNKQVQDRLALYQVFLRIYEQNRDLLNRILELEDSGNRLVASARLTYVQGVVLADTAYLVTNLIAGKTQPISNPSNYWVFGRDRHASVAITDKRLSRRHAAIRYNQKKQQFELLDLKSRNGSFINEEQIVQPQSLKDGDRIRLGGVGFTFFTYELRDVEYLPSNPNALEFSTTNSTEGQKRTAGLESEAERRKSLSELPPDETMMLLLPTQAPETSPQQSTQAPSPKEWP